MTHGASDTEPKFRELDVLRSASGTKAVISQRISNGVITFTIVKEFNRHGRPDWTAFFTEDELPDFEEMLGLVKRRITELRSDPKIDQIRERQVGARRYVVK